MEVFSAPGVLYSPNIFSCTKCLIMLFLLMMPHRIIQHTHWCDQEFFTIIKIHQFTQAWMTFIKYVISGINRSSSKHKIFSVNNFFSNLDTYLILSVFTNVSTLIEEKPGSTLSFINRMMYNQSICMHNC